MGKRKYQAILFFLLGAGIFWYVYRDLELKKLSGQLDLIHWVWLPVSLALNLLSQLIRALRWKLLLLPLDYKPKTYNLFLSMLVLSVTNLVIPRGGEIARLGVVYKFEEIPFSKLFGTALAERLADMILLILLFVALLLWQKENYEKLLNLPGVSFDPGSRLLLIAGILIGAAMLVAAYLLYVRYGARKKLVQRIREIKKNILEGFRTIARVKRKSMFVLYTIFMYALWLLMLYVIFFAYPPTENLSFAAAAFTFGTATLGFLVPVQAGIGTWHFVVIQCLLLFGIDAEAGRIFALIAHSTIMLIFLAIGPLALILLPVVNKN